MFLSDKDSHPVAYASRALIEVNYVQTEKELLSNFFQVLRGLRVTTCMYGSKILIQTDHKPRKQFWRNQQKIGWDNLNPWGPFVMFCCLWKGKIMLSLLHPCQATLCLCSIFHKIMAFQVDSIRIWRIWIYLYRYLRLISFEIIIINIDNGPWFNFTEFQNFAWDFKLSTSKCCLDVYIPMKHWRTLWRQQIFFQQNCECSLQLASV